MKKELQDIVAKENPDWTEQEVKDNAMVRLDHEDYVHYAYGNLNKAMAIILEGRTHYDMLLTGQGNFREGVATILPYKGNRDAKHKPKYYNELKQYMFTHWNAELIEGEEADDAMAKRQWAKRDKSTIIVTIDKDLDQIPGWHYNPATKETYFITLDQGNYFFFWQMLVGDSADNIPGIDNIGKVRATKLLEPLFGNVEAMQQAVREKYEQQYPDDPIAAYNEVATLLYMIREEGKPCPWLLSY